MHVKSKHEMMTFPCSQCDFKAKSKHTLRTHIKTIHEKHQVMKLSCNQCDYNGTRSSLLKHFKSIHEGLKYHCDQCEYKATQKTHLLRHVASKHAQNTDNNRVHTLKDVKADEEDFISDDEDEGGETSKDWENNEIRNNKEYLCPISVCTFSLSGKNEMSEQNHLQNNHPHVNNQMSFLMLG